MRRTIVVGRFVLYLGWNSGWYVFGLWLFVDPTKKHMSEFIIMDLHVLGAFIQVNYVRQDSTLEFIKEEIMSGENKGKIIF